MPAPDAKIESTSLGEDGKFNARSLRDTTTANEAMYGPNYVDPMNFRRPEFFVYIFSVVDARPEGTHLFRSFPPLIPNLEIKELKPGERYTLITKFPHPMNQYCMRENGERYVDSHDARRVAMDIVNPDNLTLDQDFKTDPRTVYSQGNNYGRLGVFWSTSETPSDEEINKAVRRKEEYYRARLQEARKLEMTNPKALYEYLGANDHIACDYFGEETTWHRKAVKPTLCPNCGETINPGVGFHASAAFGGIICIIDWKRAVAAGIKDKDEVPEEYRWWSTPKSSRREQPDSD